MALSGWHRGERVVRTQLGLDQVPSTDMLYSYITGEMPEQHSTFYTTKLHFLPVCILDQDGRPWGSVLAGRDGHMGFVHHPKYNTLSIEAKLWDRDPFFRHMSNLHPPGSDLIAGIGVEVSTRRRNKFAGIINKQEILGDVLNLELTVNEALGNCPKYITVRELIPHPNTTCLVEEDEPNLSPEDRLSDEAIDFILQSDTVFFGTTYTASEEEAYSYPSHLGMNHRGGRPGFMRVKPSDGRTVILPDFSGNRFMTSLGNVEATPLASLTFISFTAGDILYLTGTARNVYGAEARAVMPFQDTFTEVFVTGYTFVRDALPARQKPDRKIEPSPYSPPVKLLAEEDPQSNIFSVEKQSTALLTQIVIHSRDIATFRWESSAPLEIEPGQAIIMDFSPLLGSRQYQHMSPGRPSLVNDDFIRTWTVSNSMYEDSASTTKQFSITMREKPGGVVTGALFQMVRKISEAKPEFLRDPRALSLSVKIVGVSGEFTLPKIMRDAGVDSKGVQRLVWIAGGIGITPFLAMLSALASETQRGVVYHISLVVSTREFDVMLPLVLSSVGDSGFSSHLSIDIFSSSSLLSSDSVNDQCHDEKDANVKWVRHSGRVPASYFEERKETFLGAEGNIYICGSQPFEESVLESLAKTGVDLGRIHRDSFSY